jgi:predicted glycoside hydrolase/deacetylase ChbG (UPF0249 family)
MAHCSPDHLNSHHHITYVWPAIFELMISIAEELNIPIRNPLPVNANAAYIKKNLSPSHVSSSELLEFLKSYFSASTVVAPDQFVGHFFDRRATLEELLYLLAEVPEGITELMCHPGIVDEDLRRASDYTHRADELAALTNSQVKDAIHAHSIKLVNFSNITII